MAAECERAPVAEARRIWRTKRQPLMRMSPHRLVFLGGTGVSTTMTRLRGRSHGRSERLTTEVRRVPIIDCAA